MSFRKIRENEEKRTKQRRTEENEKVKENQTNKNVKIQRRANHEVQTVNWNTWIFEAESA